MINEKAFGPQHPDVATALNNLADALSSMSRAQEAEALFRRSLAIRERHFGDESVSVAIALDNLTSLLHQQRRYAEAEPLARRSLAIRERAFGPEHLATSNSLNNLASLLDNLKRHREAEPMLRRAVAIREAAWATDTPTLRSACTTSRPITSMCRNGRPLMQHSSARPPSRSPAPAAVRRISSGRMSGPRSAGTPTLSSGSW